MITENRATAFDPFLTTHVRLDLVMQAPSPQLLIDGDNLIVTNALDRTDDPAVLITGNNNVFVNETGATLIGTGTGDGPEPLDGAIEVSGTGNQIHNQLGGVVTGVNGIVGIGSGNAVVNDGEVLAANLLAPIAGDSTALSLGDNANVQNAGLVRAEAGRNAIAVDMAIGGVVDNSGTVEAVGGTFAFGIGISQDGLINNSGDVVVTASLSGFGLTASSSGGTILNSGSVQVTSTSSSAIGVGTVGATTIWNGGSIEAIAAGGRSATGIEAVGGSLENLGTISANVSQVSLEAQSVGAFLASATGSNAGTITATTIDGVSVGVVTIGGGSADSIASFANSGDILATGLQAFGFNATNFSELTNTGTITAIGSIDPPSESGRSAGLELQNDASVVNSGSISAQANFEVAGVFALDRANIQNGGLVEATDGFASGTGISVGADGTIVNTGTVLAQAEFGATGISAGDRANVQNDGVVEASGLGVTGVGVGSFSSVVNSGTVLAHAGDFATGISGIFQSSFRNDGVIDVAADSFAIGIETFVNSMVVNTGSILVSAANGLSAGVALSFDSRMSNTGEITATGMQATGVGLFDGAELTNTGSIVAMGAEAKAVEAIDSASVVNDGAILAQSVPAGQPSVGILFDSSTAAQKSVVNNGTITADIAISDNTASPDPEFELLTVQNTGLITGAVALGNGVDIVFNTGTINGDVNLGSGDDVFDGRGGMVNGIVDGGAGDDIIHGGVGNEILIGGDGTDTIFGSAGADAIDGGAGLDTLDYSASAAGVQVNLGDATLSTSAPIKAGAGTAFGGDAEGDTFQGIEKVIGSAFDDFVYGSPDGSIVELGDGNDVFDNRKAESGDDVVDLGAGNDVARAGAGNDLVQGGAGNDWLSGEDGNDTLFGQDGNDLLLGGLGDDQLDGGAGDDLLAGGGGNDLFTFGLDGGNDLIFGFEAGAGSEDAVDLTAFDTILSFDDVLAIASQTGGGHGGVSTVLTFDAETTLTFQGVRLAELNETDFIIV